MIYVIEAFYRDNELLAFEEELPAGKDQEVKRIMGWTAEQQGWEGYNLTNEQLGALENLLGKKIYDPAYLFQLSCNA
ncbi:hypothetical protein [Pseudomonas sp. C2B4]|uniref:DUF7683 domain-containing protein n=1 Tax=Pseudomonas sp. C2B4 TaxID=2735270 RepID=UPI001586B0FB|nr:hypothetical protein [Pseudomonas sp. C2B4]NUU35054.1 hypothetical protein [Pseudomonas sp. C2B4]